MSLENFEWKWLKIVVLLMTMHVNLFFCSTQTKKMESKHGITSRKCQKHVCKAGDYTGDFDRFLQNSDAK